MSTDSRKPAREWSLKGYIFDDNGRPGFSGYPDINAVGPELSEGEIVIVVERRALDAALAERENALELAHERKIKLMERNLELLKLSSERDQAVADAKKMLRAIVGIQIDAIKCTGVDQHIISGWAKRLVDTALTPEILERYGV